LKRVCSFTLCPADRGSVFVPGRGQGRVGERSLPGCANPIAQKDFYAMKTLFDPLVVKKQTLAAPTDIFANGDAADEARKKRVAAEAPLDTAAAKLGERTPG